MFIRVISLFSFLRVFRVFVVTFRVFVVNLFSLELSMDRQISSMKIKTPARFILV